MLDRESFTSVRGMRTPPGRIDMIPSAVTGVPLKYFTPDLLPDLIERCSSFVSVPEVGAKDPALMLMFLGHLSRVRGDTTDPAYSKLLGQAFFGRLDCTDTNAMVRLGASISPRASGLRQEIAFVGAPTASQAKLVFPSHECLPELLASLAGSFAKPPKGMDAAVFAALVAFFAVHAHPFKDGNGRWSRLLAVQAGAALGAGDSGLVAALFQSTFKYELAFSIWPKAYLSGLGEYLDASRSFEESLREAIDPVALELCSDVLKSLRRQYAVVREYEQSAALLFSSHPRDVPSLISSSLALSGKRERWLRDDLQETAGKISPSASLADIFELIARAADAAVQRANEHAKRSFQ